MGDRVTLSYQETKDGPAVPVTPDTPLPVGGASGAADDAAYTDETGADDGTVISLLKGIYAQLTIIATNTTPA